MTPAGDGARPEPAAAKAAAPEEAAAEMAAAEEAAAEVLAGVDLTEYAVAAGLALPDGVGQALAA